VKGRTVTLKIKYHDFRLITRSRSFPQPVEDRELIAATARELLRSTRPEEARIRLLGVSLSNFGELDQRRGKGKHTNQLELF
jgi:DNA polymerase-4